MDRKNLAGSLICLIFLIFIANFLANKFYWYSSIWYFDMIMHFLGGFWVGLAGVYLFQPKEVSFNSVINILLFVFFIGVGWEVFEMLVNDVIVKNSLDFIDIASDIFFDLSGGLCAILYLWKKLQKKQ
jgi:CDP-diglyceride synthetase